MNYLWALPNPVVRLPLLIVGLLTGGSARFVDGVVEVWGGALFLTRAHERIHVRQYERWGPFFIPAYFLAGLVAILRGGHGYRDNRFERQAFADTGTIRR